MNFAYGFATLAIHAGQDADAATGTVTPPIYQTSTYKQDRVGELRGGYEYSRAGNPTRTALEQCLTAIEQHIPPASLSRVSAYDWFGSLLCDPIGLALAGWSRPGSG
jgi:cystathionine gamma-synthase